LGFAEPPNGVAAGFALSPDVGPTTSGACAALRGSRPPLDVSPDALVNGTSSAAGVWTVRAGTGAALGGEVREGTALGRAVRDGTLGGAAVRTAAGGAGTA
jgi:hypothetical protein